MRLYWLHKCLGFIAQHWILHNSINWASIINHTQVRTHARTHKQKNTRLCYENTWHAAPYLLLSPATPTNYNRDSFYYHDKRCDHWTFFIWQHGISKDNRCHYGWLTTAVLSLTHDRHIKSPLIILEECYFNKQKGVHLQLFIQMNVCTESRVSEWVCMRASTFGCMKERL